MKVICPHCQTSLSVADSLAGKERRCPNCDKTITIPASDSPPRAKTESQQEQPKATFDPNAYGFVESMGWICLVFWIVPALLALETGDVPPGLWPLCSLAAIGVGRLEEIRRQLKKKR